MGYEVKEAMVSEVDLSLMATDMPAFQKSVFNASVTKDGNKVNDVPLKDYLKLMPEVMKVNGFGDEEGND